MTGEAEVAARATLHEASRRSRIDAANAELIRLGENAIFRLPAGMIARVTRPGQVQVAAREVNVARWLEASGIPAVQAISGVEQPVDVDGRAVTWWRELPPHQHGTALQVAGALRRLHDLPIPTGFELGTIDPFVRLTERIGRASVLSPDDRTWMLDHLTELKGRYAELPPGLPHCVVHGDAWVGNVVGTSDGRAVLLDLERCSVGPPEWDLTSTAVKRFTLGGITIDDYQAFTRSYGYDVTTWEGFETLRDIREFRLTTMAAQVASENPARRDEIERRLASIRGTRGSRPWTDWQPVP
ncbi:phosphotransferase family protein [Sphaerisporangium sp. NPDC049003]|uniref:phosphotransferase family protein n=1 Tax=Sphaerisporangium sp. NPDC049003 TaxID=3364517 RepID=UPI00371FE112